MFIKYLEDGGIQEVSELEYYRDYTAELERMVFAYILNGKISITDIEPSILKRRFSFFIYADRASRYLRNIEDVKNHYNMLRLLNEYIAELKGKGLNTAIYQDYYDNSARIAMRNPRYRKYCSDLEKEEKEEQKKKQKNKTEQNGSCRLM